MVQLADKTLQQELKEYFGSKSMSDKEIPNFIVNNLNPKFALRPYQKETFQNFLSYMEDNYPHEKNIINLLFHMATGSGKTLIMAGLILYFYKQGYRDFLFFVNATNIIEKTKENFTKSLSPKYLFNEKIFFDNREIKIRQVNNFDQSSGDDINIHFTTIQGLHSKLHNISENSLSFSDFKDKNIVLIADEAHHINVETKQGLSPQEKEYKDSWEKTVSLILNNNPQNVLLEFTATMDLDNPAIKTKYSSKIIFDYTLKKFCEDKYSKDVHLLRADLEPIDRALQAVILSQYRRKIAERNGIFLKPIILMKSETNKETEANYESFINRIENLTLRDINKIKKIQSAADGEGEISKNVIEQAFDYFNKAGISGENLIKELKEDFSREKCIYIHSKEDSEAKQILVNNLEGYTNEIRVIFNTDKLTEGWDVLNLFDIVRLYETRPSGHGRISEKTVSEAQLIGRGARYYPFEYKDFQKDKRKFDADLNNELRLLEELHYHSPNDHRYISELKQALIQAGIWTENLTVVNVQLKASFKDSDFYKNGFIFLNSKEKKYTKTDLQKLIQDKSRSFEYSFRSKIVADSGIFEDVKDINVGNTKLAKFAEFSNSIFRTALSMIDFYRFSNLKEYLPIESSDDFILQLKKYEVMTRFMPQNVTQKDKLSIVISVLNNLKSLLEKDEQKWQGSKLFNPMPIREKASIKKVLKFATIPSDREIGKATKDSSQFQFLSLNSQDWYVYDECFGTSEEKYFISCIYLVKDEIKKQYDKFYLIRNERDFKIYEFDSGKAFEPDFVLYLQAKNSKAREIYQLFIEPKGNHLIEADSWKEDFLKRIRKNGKTELILQNTRFNLYGLPFYNESKKNIFINEFKEILQIK
ncbi:MAG: DEAD/DEAH box helicase family protein [Elusimicrobiota bacterium]|jgi:type III restriction enzyme|nr:DEAD/DEAH box helicase family protein [Elusimicrobiota bacterium]